MTKDQIAASLEEAFSRHGFAEPSVAQLKTACNVSLRTLYRYYPSKEAMIVGALEYRHQRYLTILTDNLPTDSTESILCIFDKLEQWMIKSAPNGCLSMNAIAAFPDNSLINQAVKKYKLDVQHIFVHQSERAELATVLYLLHEGVSSAWPLIGRDAITAAKNAAVHILK
ncbi:TetR/AcrR family transcriptional regulator [Vibrio sp. F74]|uniref:TetR/AcrR family transcriptional regulator n=1 Tax=Vibrio sp. F74 TaxID=700020 RepID=UPI0035F5A08D